MDLRSERDIEQLRRVALAQQVQIEQLLRVLRAKCEELATLKGSEGELQQTLKLIEELTRRTAATTAQAAAAAHNATEPARTRKPRGDAPTAVENLM
jgi:hypothetical protein